MCLVSGLYFPTQNKDSFNFLETIINKAFFAVQTVNLFFPLSVKIWVGAFR